MFGNKRKAGNTVIGAVEQMTNGDTLLTIGTESLMEPGELRNPEMIRLTPEEREQLIQALIDTDSRTSQTY